MFPILEVFRSSKRAPSQFVAGTTKIFYVFRVIPPNHGVTKLLRPTNAQCHKFSVTHRKFQRQKTKAKIEVFSQFLNFFDTRNFQSPKGPPKKMFGAVGQKNLSFFDTPVNKDRMSLPKGQMV